MARVVHMKDDVAGIELFDTNADQVSAAQDRTTVLPYVASSSHSLRL